MSSSIPQSSSTTKGGSPSSDMRRKQKEAQKKTIAQLKKGTTSTKPFTIFEKGICTACGGPKNRHTAAQHLAALCTKASCKTKTKVMCNVCRHACKRCGCGDTMLEFDIKEWVKL